MDAPDPYVPPLFLGRSLEEVRERLPLLARIQTNLLILGPPGSGKEILVHELRRLSNRRAGPLVRIRASELGDDEEASRRLFGQIRGSFPGASSDRVGLLESAAGGVLWFDEVTELSPRVQAMLHRFTEAKRMRRYCEAEERDVDVWIVATTAKGLESTGGTQRGPNPLLSRLKGYVVRIPPLRERREDIPELAAHFALPPAGMSGRQSITFSAPALRLLRLYAWPGNVRELKRVIETLVGRHDGEEISAAMLTKMPGFRQRAVRRRPDQWGDGIHRSVRKQGSGDPQETRIGYF